MQNFRFIAHFVDHFKVYPRLIIKIWVLYSQLALKGFFVWLLNRCTMHHL
jgi:hypothetical protein